ncbi:MAG: CRISPR-associated endonuclease Cas1 [Asgard group archaeon]|nr:CRISPR-associated endonuclease Cas1 [Asgard group archaeon]
MIIVVSDHGARIGKEGERLYVSYPSREKSRSYVSALRLEQVIVEAKATLTSGAIDLLTSYGIPALFLRGGKPVGILHSYVGHGTVKVRRAQILAYESPTGSLFIKEVLLGAIENKRNLLRRLIKNRQLKDKIERKLQRKVDILESIANKKIPDVGKRPITFLRNELFALEGSAAETYFSALQTIIDPHFGFTNRNRRPPRDPINSLLSYGYAILTMKVLNGVLVAGLEPYAGFLHTDRSGKPSFVLDLVEEFRQPIVDRLILRLEGKGVFSNEDFEKEGAMCKIKEGLKKHYLTELFEVFTEKMENHSTGKTMTFEQHIIHQARQAGKYFKGDIIQYKPFIMKR